MNIRRANNRPIAITLGMAAIAIIGFTGETGRAGAGDPTAVEVFPLRSVITRIQPTGVPGQILRFSVVNQNSSEQHAQPVRAQMQLYDAHGNLTRSREVYLSFGQFQSVCLNRDEVSADEPGTGRLRLQCEITYRLVDTQDRIPHDRFPAAMELLDDSPGGPILRRRH
jgi:hypothetical protein